MQKMDNSTSDRPGQEPEPEIVQAELVEASPGAPWEWVEVRPARPRRRWRLHLLLFVATCLSTLMVGTWIGDEGRGQLAALLAGLRYSVPLMTILLCHEMGHFLQAYRYGVYASLPFFIPVPIEPIGTLGAVIAMEPRVGHRRALFDIGITGPLAGLVPTMIFCIWGLYLSKPVPVSATAGGWTIGTPVIFHAMSVWRFGQLPAHYAVSLDPMAYAGWVGLLITSLNLIPIGQLDGGHILYALLRQRAYKVATFLLYAALFLVIWDWERLHSWTLMLILLMVMGPIHPPTANDEEPLGLWRYVLGWLTLAFIIIGFTPEPLRSMP
jgi:membrane-associated protease RseP (regulator of RpoE activity)